MNVGNEGEMEEKKEGRGRIKRGRGRRKRGRREYIAEK